MALTPKLSRAALLLSLASCDVPEPPPSTGGASFPPGPCGRGLVVIGTNYGASNVALLGTEGDVRSPSVLSSGARSSDISAPLSGDVVTPTEPTSGVVLIDRYPNAVVTWLDPTSGAVRAQLSVATGFASNPQDYLEVAPGKAYVSRQNSSLGASEDPDGAGGDLLIIDPQRPAITGRVALSAPAPYLPRPARLLSVNGDVWALLLRMDADYKAALDSELIAIDPSTDLPRFQLELTGAANCGAMARLGDRVAISCTGVFADGPQQQLARSAVIVLDASKTPPTELLRVDGPSLGAPPASTLTFASPDSLLVPLYGNLDLGSTDQLVSIDLTTGKKSTLFQASSAFVLGEVRCLASCGGACFLADASGPGVRRWRSGSDTPAQLSPVAPERSLPPRILGQF